MAEVNDLTGLGKALNSEVAKRTYDEGLSPVVRETGLVAGDIIKGLRLFTAPFQLAAAYQDRLTVWLEKIRSRVPPERQVECAGNVAGPVIEAMRFEATDSFCAKMFEELLAKAIDSDTQSRVHPAFPRIIGLFSPIEANALLYLRTASRHFYVTLCGKIVRDKRQQDSLYFFEARRAELRDGNTVGYEIVFREAFDRRIAASFDHMRTLGIVHIEREFISQFYGKRLTDESAVERSNRHIERFTAAVQLTEFGKDFVSTCIPEETQHNLASLQIAPSLAKRTWRNEIFPKSI